jgi:membrane associated rhomboid family serine protease
MSADIKLFLHKIRFVLGLIVLLWLIEIFERIMQVDLGMYGILPRTFQGLLGILTAPLIHGDWNHLYANTFSLLGSLVIVTIFYPKVYFHALTSIWIITGIGVWMFARDNFHIGASGVIYGLVSFIFWTGVFKYNPKSIVLALLMLSLFGGMFESIFPNVEQRISWESHLIGGIVGIAVAFVLKNVVETDEEDFRRDPWAHQDKTRRPFLPPDIFLKTKQERYLEWLEAERLRQEEAAAREAYYRSLRSDP